MIEFEVEKHIPRFIHDDREGYAVAKAIEAGVQIANGIIENTIKCLFDYDFMPEWRLDELAWETSALYDYDADIGVKREWIRNAKSNFQIIGTPYALKNFLEAKFTFVQVVEWFDYGGDPYHFKIISADAWSQEKNDWALKAVEMAKNLRTTLDEIVFGGDEVEQQSSAGISVVGTCEMAHTTII